MKCKTAERLWNKVIEKRDLAIDTGHVEDFIFAWHEWVDHIMEHGCWRWE